MVSLGATLCCVTGVELQPGEVRSIAIASARDFLQRHGTAARWDTIYVSDEYLGVALDSTFANAIGVSVDNLVLAHRAGVTTNFDIVRAGGLLLEFGHPEPIGYREAAMGLDYASTADFGGALRYFLRQSPSGSWTVVRVATIWIVEKPRGPPEYVEGLAVSNDRSEIDEEPKLARSSAAGSPVTVRPPAHTGL